MTGVGAPVGVSIFKALRSSPLSPRIVGTDADARSVGLSRADRAYVLPYVTRDEAGYVRRLTEICADEQVEMVCFGSEIEMRRLAPYAAEIRRDTGSLLVVNDAVVVETFMDKLRTALLLREHGLPAPDSVAASDREQVASFLDRHDFPIILKPRRSAGSKGVFVVTGARELELLSEYVPDAVLQEYLAPDDEEYTVGIYKSPRTGYVGQIVLKRTLGAGLTYKAEVVHDAEIESVCRAVVDTFDIWGPVNVQLRKTSRGPRIFEINLRFSSSAVIRAWFGFNEPEMTLRDAVRGEVLDRPRIRGGLAMRYWDEIYFDPGEYPPDGTSDPLFARRGRKAGNF